MKRVLLLIAICLFLTSVLSAGQAPTATFQMIDVPAQTWVNYAISADGTVVAANVGGEIFRWTADQGFVDLGAGYFLDSSVGISADGSTITATIVGPDGLTNPGRWRQSTGWINLGHPAQGCSMDGNWGSGYGVNHDGTVVVGLSWYCPGAQGFRWTEGGRMVGLSHPKGASSRASAISADGSTIVGFFEHPKQGIRRPVRWSPNRFNLFTGTTTPGEATAVTSDGSQIVGQAWDGIGIYAFYFTDASGLKSLGTLSGITTDQSIANGISDKGKVVGWSGDPFSGGTAAFIWNAANPKGKMRSLRKVLTQAGASIPNGIDLTNALAISADGSTVIGTWQDANYNQGTWIGRLK